MTSAREFVIGVIKHLIVHSYRFCIGRRDQNSASRSVTELEHQLTELCIES